jgi:hypothetical protein
LVLLVNDSENSKSAGAKPIFLLAVFISFPLARCAPPPHPALLFGGGKVPKKPKKKKIVGVGEVAVAFCFAGGFGLSEGS